MGIIKNFLMLLNDYYGVVTAFSLIFAGFWGIVKFRERIRDKRFKTYHKLIDELVNEQRQPDRNIKLDRQIAIIYELRNFPKYFSVSIRILEGLKEEWKNENQRIITEIKLALIFMKLNWILRQFCKITYISKLICHT